MQSTSDAISSLLGFKQPAEQENEEQIIEQFVHSVDDFSSQYGSEISVSYTAFNLRGPPSNFPDYGDYPQSFVMRTYGTWWDEAPSAADNFMPQINSNSVASQDFVEVSFSEAVYPLEVSVFETYNPGALVRMWARGPSSWMMLWEGEPEYVGDTPRIFTPPIRQINHPIRVLRLEFNHKLLPYYTELDAVLLKGKHPPNSPKARNQHALNSTYSLFFPKNITPVVKKGQLMSKILESNLHEMVRVVDTGPKNGSFQKLPEETVLFILSYLDVQSLCRCAQVNKDFNRLTRDLTLYRNIDLRPYWHCVDSSVMKTLTPRCVQLQRLDMSWCGSHTMILASSIVDFLKECGKNMTHLRMNCCRFVDSTVLAAIVDYCPILEDLGLRSIAGSLDWTQLKALTTLTRLDVYRSDITSAAAVEIIRANPHMLHVNVGSCKMIASMDDVAIALGAHCPNLKSVDFWKSYSLTPTGIRALGQCQKLQEIDVGWCLRAGASGEWLQWIAGPELKKLFLGALRGVCDRDLRVLPSRSPKLTQLDLLGVRAVTPEVCVAILAECKELRLLDVSFCDQIQDQEVREWRKQYPNVSIKRSFQSANVTALDPLFLAPDLA